MTELEQEQAFERYEEARALTEVAGAANTAGRSFASLGEQIGAFGQAFARASRMYGTDAERYAAWERNDPECRRVNRAHVWAARRSANRRAQLEHHEATRRERVDLAIIAFAVLVATVVAFGPLVWAVVR